LFWGLALWGQEIKKRNNRIPGGEKDMRLSLKSKKKKLKPGGGPALSAFQKQKTGTHKMGRAALEDKKHKYLSRWDRDKSLRKKKDRPRQAKNR